MKKTHSFFYAVVTTLILAVGSLTTHAAPIDQQTARQRAATFLKGNSAIKHKRAFNSAVSLKPVDIQSSLFAFNIGEKDGFIVISPDDRTEPVLAYSATGHINPENMPENMRAWFQEYANQLAYLEAHPATAAPPVSADGEITVKNPISPLLTAAWDQYAPYNLLCPITDAGRHCVTGCVATAMSQIMYYHQWPDSTIATIPEYITNTYAFQIDSIPAGLHLDWANMTNMYQGDESEEQLQAISTLMLAAGASVKMDYGAKKSLSDFRKVPSALQTYFDYSAQMHYEFRGHYGIDTWEQLVYNELEAGRPVLYVGSSSGGDHVFIIDGYSEGLFNINWGWGNVNNEGMYRLSVLKPQNNGAGASTSLDGYNFDQAAIFGIKKRGKNDKPLSDAYLTSEITSISGNKVTCYFENNTGLSDTFSYGIGYLDENGAYVDVRSSRAELSMTNDLTATFTISSSGPNDRKLQPGTYHLVPISRLYRGGEWHSSQNPDLDYIEAVVTEDYNVILTRHQPVTKLSAQVEVIGTHLVNEAHTIRVTVTNSGDEYYGRIFLRINRPNEEPLKLSEAGITVRKGMSETMDIPYTPTKKDTLIFSATLTNEIDAIAIGQTQAVFTIPPPNPDDTDAIQLQTNIVFEPVTSDGAFILSDQPRIRVTITNPTDFNYVGSVQYWLFHYKDGKKYSMVYPDRQHAKPYELKNHSTETFYLEERYEDVAESFGTYVFGDDYSLIANFRYNNKFKSVTAPKESQTVVPPVYMYRADGYSLAQMSRDTLVVPARAAAVDLRKATNTKVVKVENPNTIFFINKEAEVPEGITSNIVREGQADTITLADGYNFFLPEDITANHVRYTRTFRRGYNAATQDGWNTMILPFAVEKVEVLEADTIRDIDWLRSIEGGRQDFWIMEFKKEQGSTLIFEPAKTFVANRPYLVAVPQSIDGHSPDLTKKPITFSADNVKLMAEASTTSTGDKFMLHGIRYYQELDTIFALDRTGHQFELGDTAIQAFRAYFAIRDTTTYNFSLDKLTIEVHPTPDAIQAPSIERWGKEEKEFWYTPTGQPVGTPQRKGVYIRKGRKYIFK